MRHRRVLPLSNTGRSGGVEGVADDGLENEALTRGGETLAGADVELDVAQAQKVDDLEDLLLLVSPRPEGRQGPERRVVLDAERHRAHGAGELDRRLEGRPVFRVRSGEGLVEDGIDDQEPVVVVPRSEEHKSELQ